jgi:hypothetical protein
MIPFRETPLANGLVITYYNASSHYFGEYYRVKVVLSIEIGIPDEATTVDSSLAPADEIGNDSFTYRRVLERMAVREAEVPRVIEVLVDEYLSHALPYLSSPDFPQKAYLAERRSVCHHHDRQRRYTTA